MNCRNCDYELWNLTTRECPECGTAFQPSEYEFVPQSVRFCCPHCDHPYYGTGPKGHVEPNSFQCLRCGQAVAMDEMVLRPGLGVEEQFTRPDTMPWIDRRQRGRVRAWFQMIGKGLTSPGQLIAATPPESSLRQAWVFSLICTAVFFIPGSAMHVFYGYMMLVYGAPGVTSGAGLGWATMPVFVVVFLLGTVAMVMLVIGLWTLIAHAVLRLTGTVEHSYRRTSQALLYSAGANVFTAVPCFGMLLGSVWWTVSAVLMLRRAHGVGATRAVFAVGLLPCALIAGWFGLYAFAMIGGPMMAARAAAGPWNVQQGSPGYQTSVVNYSLLAYGSQQGSAPAHALEVATTATASMFPGSAPVLFCDPSTKTTPRDIPVGDGTLAGFLAATRGEQFGMIADITQSMPEGVVAHRLGDFVFTYHGSTWDARLWTVVMLPDPAVNGVPMATDPVIIGTADYGVTEVTAGELPDLLKEQNTIRATFNLPPLPDLMAVTHDKPAARK